MHSWVSRLVVAGIAWAWTTPFGDWSLYGFNRFCTWARLPLKVWLAGSRGRRLVVLVPGLSVQTLLLEGIAEIIASNGITGVEPQRFPFFTDCSVPVAALVTQSPGMDCFLSTGNLIDPIYRISLMGSLRNVRYTPSFLMVTATSQHFSPETNWRTCTALLGAEPASIILVMPPALSLPS